MPLPPFLEKLRTRMSDVRYEAAIDPAFESAVDDFMGTQMMASGVRMRLGKKQGNAQRPSPSMSGYRHTVTSASIDFTQTYPPHL